MVAPPAVPQVRGPRRGAQGPLARENRRGFPPEATVEIRETRAGVEEVAPHDTVPLSPESRARGTPKGPTNSYGVSRTWGRTCGTTSSPPAACVTASSATSRAGLTVSLSDRPASLLTRLVPLAVFVASRAGTRKIMKRQLLLLPKVLDPPLRYFPESHHSGSLRFSIWREYAPSPMAFGCRKHCGCGQHPSPTPTPDVGLDTSCLLAADPGRSSSTWTS